jgi:hypothetical protein
MAAQFSTAGKSVRAATCHHEQSARTSTSRPPIPQYSCHSSSALSITPRIKHEPRRRQRQQSRTRDRPRTPYNFMSIGSRDRKSVGRLNLPTNAGTTTPLQTLSPRPTVFEPGAKKHAKRSMSSFLLPRTPASEPDLAKKNNVDANAVQGHVPVTGTAELSLPAAPRKEDGDRLGSSGHLPVTGHPYVSRQRQSRKDSATKSFYDMPLSASRTAALTSHPVGKEDLKSAEEFQTPREPDGAWKGDYVER